MSSGRDVLPKPFLSLTDCPTLKRCVVPHGGADGHLVPVVAAVMIISGPFQVRHRDPPGFGHHLALVRILADGRQVDEGTDTSPGKSGYGFKPLLVLIDTIVAGRLRRVEARQQEGRSKPDDGPGSAHCHGRNISAREHAKALLHFIHPGRKDPVAEVLLWPAPEYN